MDALQPPRLAGRKRPFPVEVLNVEDGQPEAGPPKKRRKFDVDTLVGM